MTLLPLTPHPQSCSHTLRHLTLLMPADLTKSLAGYSLLLPCPLFGSAPGRSLYVPHPTLASHSPPPAAGLSSKFLVKSPTEKCHQDLSGQEEGEG